MSHTTFALNTGVSYRTHLAAALTAEGYTRVAEGVTAPGNVTNPQAVAIGLPVLPSVYDVWRSPDSGSTYGETWFLVVGDYTNQGYRAATIAVAEGFDVATGLFTKVAPLSNNIAPAADFSTGATTYGLHQMHTVGPVFAEGAGSTFQLNINKDRVLMWIAGSSGYYFGKADRFYPAAIDPIAPVIGAQINSGASASATSWGHTTREPGQSGVNAFNWRVQFHGNTSTLSNYDRVLQLNNFWNAVDAILNRPSLSPAAIHCSRFPNVSTRAVLRDVRWAGVQANVSATDTLTETLADGTTRTYMPIGVLGLFGPTF